MSGLNRLLGFVNSLKQAIGIGDPDLQRGRIGREEADKKALRAMGQKNPDGLKNSYNESPKELQTHTLTSRGHEPVVTSEQLSHKAPQDAAREPVRD